MMDLAENQENIERDVLNREALELDVLRPFAAAFAGKQTTVLIDPPLDTLPELSSHLDEQDILIIASTNPPAKSELTTLLHHAGFDTPVFYYPFPDPLNPSILLTHQAFNTPGFNTANLIRPAIDRNILPTAQNHGHMIPFKNAMLIVATKNNTPLLSPEQLGFSFSSNRTAPFNKMNVFYKNADGRIMVRHIPYDLDAGTGRPLPATQLLTEEPYLPGRLYSLDLHDLLLTPEWSIKRIAKWARPYLDLLREQAQTDAGGGWLDGRFLDLTPFNLLWHQHRFGMIDLEWKAHDPLPLPYVFFRGLYHTFARVPYVLPPAPGTPLNIYGLCLAVAAELGFDVSGLLEKFLELEPHFFGAIFPGNGPAPHDADLPLPASTAASPKTHSRLYPLHNLHLQVFVETETHPFSEETSTWQSIGLTHEPAIYSIPLPHFTADTIKLRIDPSDHNGLLLLHAVDLRTTDGTGLFHWAPWAKSDAELRGMTILNAGQRLSDPVTVLINADPMLIFTLPAEYHEKPPSPVVLELQLSTITPEIFDTVTTLLCDLAQLTS